MKNEEGRATEIAREQFIRDEVGSSLDNYTVVTKSQADAIEVAFVPNQPSLAPDSSGKVNVTVGGRTVFGREVHYVIDQKTFGIIRRFFAR